MNAGTDAQQGELLPGIASGETIADARVHRAERPVGRAGHHDGGGAARATATRSTGTKMFVIDGHTANTIVVGGAQGTSGEDGISFFAVDGDAAGLTRTPLATMDQTRKQARLDFSDVAADAARASPARLGRAVQDARPGGRRPVERDGRRRAEGARDVGRVREGARAVRPAHRLVPGHQAQVRRHAARGRVGQVGGVLRGVGAAEDNEELPVVASLAKAYCSDAYFHAAAENIQIHGGIGFTWEHDAHLYFKRAKSSEILLGDATHQPPPPPPTHRYLGKTPAWGGRGRPARTGAVVGLAAVLVIREAGRIAKEPPPALFDIDEAHDWVVGARSRRRRRHAHVR